MTEPLTAAGTDAASLTVRLANVGESPILFTSGTAIGTIVGSDGQVVNSNVMSVADVGIPVDLAPGAVAELPLLVSTASCDPHLGYVLPAGQYRLIAEVQHADGDVTTLVSEPAVITVAP